MQEIIGTNSNKVKKVFMKVIGLTGGMGTGKSTVSEYLAQKGIKIVDADKIARMVTEKGSDTLKRLVKAFGNSILKEDGSLDRKALAKLAFAYSTSDMPKITVILGHAIGASFVLLGSKALGADLVYALNDAEIGALSAESGVAFAWNNYITLKKSREQLINEWKATVSSPSVAAASGEIDDIISINELRARICAAFSMLASKADEKPSRKHANMPL